MFLHTYARACARAHTCARASAVIGFLCFLIKNQLYNKIFIYFPILFVLILLLLYLNIFQLYLNIYKSYQYSTLDL